VYNTYESKRDCSTDTLESSVTLKDVRMENVPAQAVRVFSVSQKANVSQPTEVTAVILQYKTLLALVGVWHVPRVAATPSLFDLSSATLVLSACCRLTACHATYSSWWFDIPTLCLVSSPWGVCHAVIMELGCHLEMIVHTGKAYTTHMRLIAEVNLETTASLNNDAAEVVHYTYQVPPWPMTASLTSPKAGSTTTV